MKNIKDIYHEFVEETRLPVDWDEQLSDALKSYKPEDLNTVEDHKMFIEALSQLRRQNVKSMKLIGNNFKKTISSLLGVGNDGLYSGDLRFIYELIQNVDDCDYEDLEDCRLEIKFEYDPAPGKIILTYNEKGFTPFNVFAITGVAEVSKNILADKVEIGEKGIGFKSVFGVSDKVRIESGMFSFELNKDNFIIPIPKYDDYKFTNGTRVTIYLDSNHNAKELHKQLLHNYEEKDAILNQNPILFLNKLTHLKLYYDNYRYIEFDVEKRKPVSRNEINIEDEVIVSADLHYAFDCRSANYSTIISCIRYTMPVIYGLEECKSRYGKDIAFKERRHNIIAIFPKELDDLEDYSNGLLYSFLPTQIKISAPFVLHVPYKLDGSRQFVDQQNNNAWFEYTCERLGYFLKKIYLDLAKRVKAEIVRYLPKNGSYFFKHDNDKVKCIQIPELRATSIYREKIFYCGDKTFESVDNIMSFEKGFQCENPARIFELLNLNKKLFIPYSNDIDMSKFKVSIISNVREKLFENGLLQEDKFEEIADILGQSEDQINYFDFIAKKAKIDLTYKQVSVISSHKKLYKSFSYLSEKLIEYKKSPSVNFVGNFAPIDEDSSNLIKDLAKSSDLDPIFEKYLQSINYRLIGKDGVQDDFFLAGKNGIVLAKDTPLGAFSGLSSHFDSRKTFSASLQLRQASDRLNNANEDMPNEEYLKLLRGVRYSLIGAFGRKVYANYISIINNAGTDKNRFLFELLQNADDCHYADNVIPSFKLAVDDEDSNIITVSYNEIGFTKSNVRAITAIGESTKKLLLNGEDKAIGEKGVGFKSVFGVAEYVDIHSNGFDFRLTSDQPTVPEKIKTLQNYIGTVMNYKIKDRSILRNFSENKILSTCLCLRNLKNIDICGIQVSIEDRDNTRTITIQGKKYVFERFIYDFEVEDEEAIEERNSNQKSISRHQYIACYIPPKNYNNEHLFLYSGLPISKVECNIPLVIDAPFELSTSRDDVLESSWNHCIYNAMYEAIIAVMELKKRDMKLDVLRYVHYQNQNGNITFHIFSNRYLNGFGWINQLKKMEIIPIFAKNEFVKPDSTRRIVPEIIANVLETTDCEDIPGTIVDTRKKSQYISLLEILGCRRLTPEEEIEFFKSYLYIYLKDKKLRDSFYNYLSSKHSEYESKGLSADIRALKIYPIRTSDGYSYVEFNNNIYTHPSKISDDEFLVLETKVLSYEKCQEILGPSCRINELSPEVYEARYRKNIEDLINSHRPAEETATTLLKEFRFNFDEFKKCKPSLMGLIDEIPMEMASGDYNRGNKYINANDYIIESPIMKEMYVSDKYRPLAEFLGCTDVSDIYYSDIDYDISEVTDTDIEDILGYFKHYIDILSEMFTDGLISEEQIEKYDLQFLINDEDLEEDDEDEEFPGKRVSNAYLLKKHIMNQFVNNPNPYIKKKRIVWEPTSEVNKSTYTTAMYGSKNNDNKCFCQMCKKRVNKTYIERNDIQKKPKYGWEQMYLCLCLNCSKDYIYLRNNQTVWKNFIDEIKNTVITDQDTIDINIGNRTITFTATHLAEVQEIIKIEAKDESI